MKKTLVIMGSHPRTLKLFDWSRTDCEIWLFNEAANAKDEKGKLKYPKCDAVFQMHHEAIWRNPKNRSDQEHYKWLSSGKTPPIYMQKAYPDVPNAVRYPIEDVLSLVKNVLTAVNGEKKKFQYFTSSPDYALALVAHMWKGGKRYRRVEVWGIELETESEVYFSQRTGLGFWLGYLAALGVLLVFNGNIFNEPMYGYEGDVALSSKDIEKRIADLTAELGNDSERYQKEAKVFLESLPRLLTQDIGVEIEKELNEILKRNERAAILNGKIKESQRYLQKAKTMESATGTSVFAAGEFDGARQDYTKQQLQIQLEMVNFNSQVAAQLRKLLGFEKGSQERKRAVDEFGHVIAEFMNKNMFLFHVVGAIQDNQYYLDSCRQSLRLAKNRR
jgi:hypothetical protein